jgi:DNA-binding Lrp family transcriptional regulator
MAACLQHELRRRIRDYLRAHGKSTLTEIAHGIGSYEQLVLYHLGEMVSAGIVVKEEAKVNGKRVSFYRLSSEYEEVFDVKPDLFPLYVVSAVYIVLAVSAYVLGDAVLSYLKFLGIVTVEQLISICVFTLAAIFSVIAYYHLKESANKINIFAKRKNGR